MPDWLVEGDTTVYALLALLGVIFVALWWQSRNRGYVIAAGIVGVLLLGYFLLDRLVESDREQMIRKVREIAAAISSRNPDAAFAHVSDDFRRGGVDKKGFRNFADGRVRSGFVSDVVVWDCNVTEQNRANRRGAVECYFKVHGSFGETPPGAFVRVVFKLDNDGQWRVQDFDWFQATANSKSPMPIPGWGGQ
jgi:hypothetical protein